MSLDSISIFSHTVSNGLISVLNERNPNALPASFGWWHLSATYQLPSEGGYFWRFNMALTVEEKRKRWNISAKKYYQKNKEVCKKRAEKYRKNNLPKYAKLLFEWRRRNKAKHDEWWKNYRDKNRKNLSRKHRDYVRSRPELQNRIRQQNKLWRLKNPDKARELKTKYRLRRRGTPYARSLEWYLVKVRRGIKTFTCYYCQKTFHKKHLQFDHIIPIAKGGQHVIENICKSCKWCNGTKKANMISDIDFLPQPLLSL